MSTGRAERGRTLGVKEFEIDIRSLRRWKKIRGCDNPNQTRLYAAFGLWLHKNKQIMNSLADYLRSSLL